MIGLNVIDKKDQGPSRMVNRSLFSASGQHRMAFAQPVTKSCHEKTSGTQGIFNLPLDNLSTAVCKKIFHNTGNGCKNSD